MQREKIREPAQLIWSNERNFDRNTDFT